MAKTTTSIHLAAYLHGRGKTLLVDGDPNRSATLWNSRGALPFTVIDEKQSLRYARGNTFEHIVIDTAAHPSDEDLESLARGCDLLVLPSTPDLLALDALLLTVKALKSMRVDNYKVLLTMCPPNPSRDAEEARKVLAGDGVPIFTGSVRRLVAFQRAALAGVTVDQVNDPRAAFGWRDYERVGEEIYG